MLATMCDTSQSYCNLDYSVGIIPRKSCQGRLRTKAQTLLACSLHHAAHMEQPALRESFHRRCVAQAYRSAELLAFLI